MEWAISAASNGGGMEVENDGMRKRQKIKRNILQSIHARTVQSALIPI